jgi:hypothetical protein
MSGKCVVALATGDDFGTARQGLEDLQGSGSKYLVLIWEVAKENAQIFYVF